MKKLVLILTSIVLFSCSSDDNNQSLETNIFIDGVSFTPTSFKVVNGNSNVVDESSLVFSLTKGTVNKVSYEALIFTVNYPVTLSSAPTGTYEFGIGETATTLYANGTYAKGTNYYSLAGYSVKVTAWGGKKYKLEFQNIEAVGIPSGTIKIISGYCEGEFK